MSEPDGLTAAQTEVVELRALFDLQWRRIREATERWQKAHPEIKDVELIWPDLGDMLYWLLERNTTLETKLKALVVHEEALRVGNVVVAATDAATRATDYLARAGYAGLPRSDLTRAYIAGTMLARAARRAADLPPGKEGL